MNKCGQHNSSNLCLSFSLLLLCVCVYVRARARKGVGNSRHINTAHKISGEADRPVRNAWPDCQKVVKVPMKMKMLTELSKVHLL
jgi:hypothetical protein